MLHLAGRTSLQNFGNSVYPALPASFGGDNKSRRSLLSGVYTRGSKRSHAGGKCETCRGLHNCQGMTTQITLCIILKLVLTVSEEEKKLGEGASRDRPFFDA